MAKLSKRSTYISSIDEREKFFFYIPLVKTDLQASNLATANSSSKEFLFNINNVPGKVAQVSFVVQLCKNKTTTTVFLLCLIKGFGI